jgi:peptidoglycan/LPS O-acetylase OafA/YrhL
MANNFHFIRLVASVFVVYSHSFYLMGNYKDQLDILSGSKLTFGNLGVSIFLIVSGYLITNSIYYASSSFNFLWKRILRVLPALWVMLLLSVFVIAPIFSYLPVNKFFVEDISSYTFLLNGLLFIPNAFKIDTVFTHNPLGTYNGCLWTIAYEMFFYFIVVCFFKVRLMKVKWLVLLQWVVFVMIQLYLGDRIYTYSYSTIFLLNLNIADTFKLFIYFEAGMLMYLFKDLLRINRKVLVLLTFLLILSFLKFETIYLQLLLPLVIIPFAFDRGANFSYVGNYGDFSYGVYLYGYIVQQCLVSLRLPFLNPYILFFISITITLIISYFSWHFIEKKILRFKSLVK